MSVKRCVLGMVGVGCGMGCGTVFADRPPSAVPSAPPATSPDYEEMVAKVVQLSVVDVRAQVRAQVLDLIDDERRRMRLKAEELVSNELHEQLLSPRVQNALHHCQSKLQSKLRESYEDQLLTLTRKNVLFEGIRLDCEANCNAMLGKMILINIITTVAIVGLYAMHK